MLRFKELGAARPTVGASLLRWRVVRGELVPARPMIVICLVSDNAREYMSNTISTLAGAAGVPRLWARKEACIMSAVQSEADMTGPVHVSSVFCSQVHLNACQFSVFQRSTFSQRAALSSSTAEPS